MADLGAVRHVDLDGVERVPERLYLHEEAGHSAGLQRIVRPRRATTPLSLREMVRALRASHDRTDSTYSIPPAPMPAETVAPKGTHHGKSARR
jgi:hypothetical protein